MHKLQNNSLSVETSIAQASPVYLNDRVAEEDPHKALDLIIKLSERFVPALARTEVTGADGTDIFESIKFNFGPPIDSDKRIQDERTEE